LKYRNKTQIIPLILEAANGGTSKTRLMYRTFLSYRQLREYLSIMMTQGLIKYDDEYSKIRTTEKGLRMLNTYQYISEEFHV
jgi:predicted transcriptional regulator